MQCGFCGWRATVLHSWSAQFRELYQLSGVGEAEITCICPGCHGLVGSKDKFPFFKLDGDPTGKDNWGLDLDPDLYGDDLPAPFCGRVQDHVSTVETPESGTELDFI